MLSKQLSFLKNSNGQLMEKDVLQHSPSSAAQWSLLQMQIQTGRPCHFYYPKKSYKLDFPFCCTLVIFNIKGAINLLKLSQQQKGGVYQEKIYFFLSLYRVCKKGNSPWYSESARTVTLPGSISGLQRAGKLLVLCPSLAHHWRSWAQSGPK